MDGAGWQETAEDAHHPACPVGKRQVSGPPSVKSWHTGGEHF